MKFFGLEIPLFYEAADHCVKVFFFTKPLIKKMLTILRGKKL